MKKTIWSLVLVVALGIAAAGVYLWLQGETPEPQEPPPPPPVKEPAIRYPIEEPSPAGESAAETAKPLPPLAESDGAMRDALAKLFGRKLERFFNLQEIIHRIVATVDNLPREKISWQLMPVKPVPGRLVTTGKGESLSLSAKNAARYRPYIELAETVPTSALVEVYVHFYPLFQQQYEELGYPGKYFNDRLVQVIDHLLAAPDVQGPVRLIQPKIMYELADPKLEALSAGQKILVRMGNENAAKVKAKLREVRSAIVSQGPKR
jgi:hypothetical protein